MREELKWKYDEVASMFYVPVGGYVILAQNAHMKTKKILGPGLKEYSREEPVRYGDIYIAFRRERTFDGGVVALDETETVEGGIAVSEADKVIAELKRAVALLDEKK